MVRLFCSIPGPAIHVGKMRSWLTCQKYIGFIQRMYPNLYLAAISSYIDPFRPSLYDSRIVKR
jgi:hypothetical protein